MLDRLVQALADEMERPTEALAHEQNVDSTGFAVVLADKPDRKLVDEPTEKLAAKPEKVTGELAGERAG